MSRKSKPPPASSPSNTLSVRSDPEQVLITLFDGTLTRVTSGYGSLGIGLPDGLYLLTFDTGLSTQQRYVAVRGPTDLGTVRVPFPSAAPIEGTVGFRPEHATAAWQLSLAPSAGFGQGGRLMVFARAAPDVTDWSPSFPGLRVVNAAGENLTANAEHLRVNAGEGWIGWCADVPPGGYLLRCRPESLGTVFDQPLWVSPGWLVSAFLVARWAGPKERRTVRLDLDSMTLHQGRLDIGFLPHDEHARAIQLAMELAVTGWRSWRRILPDNPASLDVLLDEKFTNPLLGVIAAHSLWQADPPDIPLLRKLYRALESLLPDHPDTLALTALAHQRGLTGVGPVRPLSWPPVFESSYRAALEVDWQGAGGVLAADGPAARWASRLLQGTFWARLPRPRSSTRSVETFQRPRAEGDAAAFLSYWLADNLRELPALRHLPGPSTSRLEEGAATAFWQRFAASDDPLLKRLAVQAESLYAGWISSSDTSQVSRLRTITIEDLAQSLGLSRSGLHLALTRWLFQADPEAAMRAPAPDWPPGDGRAFIRSERCGRLLLEEIEALVRRDPHRDFTDAAAHVYGWLDRRLAKNRSFVNGKRFPSERAFRAYLRRAAANAALMAERRLREDESLDAVDLDADLALDPVALADLNEKVERLPPRHREALQRLFFQEEDFDVVVSIMGVTDNQLQRLFREAVERIHGG